MKNQITRIFKGKKDWSLSLSSGVSFKLKTSKNELCLVRGLLEG